MKPAEPPVGSIEARAILIDHVYHAEFVRPCSDGELQTMELTQKDAWDWNLEQGAVIWIRLSESGGCKIVRKHGAKRYARS